LQSKLAFPIQICFSSCLVIFDVKSSTQLFNFGAFVQVLLFVVHNY